MRLRTERKRTWKQRIGVTLTAISLLIPGFPNAGVQAAAGTCTGTTPWATYLTRVTASTSGKDPDGDSASPVISRDGLKVAFTSSASDLVTGDTNGVDDVFQFDRTSKTLRRVTAGTGWESDGVSRFPALSKDGRFTAFLSAADNLLPGDTNGVDDIFLYDVTTGTTLESVSTSGTQADQAYTAAGPALSENGSMIAFVSGATNLAAGDTNGKADVFLRDRTQGTTTLISRGLSGAPADSDSTAASISPEGDAVAYSSNATNLVPGDTNGHSDIFLYDAGTGNTTRISVDSQGNEANGDSTIAPFGAVSSKGNYVVFSSQADNLVPGDTNGHADIFLYNRQTGTLKRISVSDTGQQANGDSWDAKITKDGLFVTFTSKADNLTPGVKAGTTNVYRYDITRRRIALVNATRFGLAGNADATSPSISDDGRYVAFASAATDLVPNKSTNATEIFVRDMLSPSFPLNLTSAVAAGSSITLNFGRPLQQTSVPSPCDFVVTVNGSPRAVSKVAVLSSAVQLTISPGLSQQDAVTVDYTPGTNPIQDTLLIAAQPFTGLAATNKTRAVSLRTATVTGADLVMAFDSDLDTSSRPDSTDFTVNADKSAVAVQSVSMDARRVRLTLAAPVPPGSYVQVGYTPGAHPLQSQTGGLIGSFSGQPVENQTATLSVDTATSTATNAKITLNFDQVLDQNSVPDPNDFTVTVGATTPPTTFHPRAVSVASRTVLLTLPQVLQEGDVVTLDYTPGTKPLQTPTWSPLGPLSSLQVPNTTVAPKILAPSVNANQLQFSLSRRIDTTSVPNSNDFSVTVNGKAQNPTRVTLDAVRVTLTLPAAVKPGDTVTLDYTPQSGSRSLQDAIGSRVVPTSSSLPVANVTPAPLLRSASIVTDTLTLTFTRALDATSLPAMGDFQVYVNGKSITPASVSISERSVKLILPTAVRAGDTVTLDYTPGSPVIQDQVGSPAPGFTGQAVTNTTVAPVAVRPRVVAKQLTIPFNRALDSLSVPAATDFSVSVSGTAQTPASVAISGSVVTLTLATPVRPGDTVLLNYTPNQASPLRDTSRSQVAAISGLPVKNDTTPVFLSATVQGAQLTLLYNVALSTASVPLPTDFTVKANGTTTIPVSSVSISGRSVVLTLTGAVTPADTITVSYTATGGKQISDQNANPAQDLTAQPATNQTVLPVLGNATVNTKTLYLTFSRPLDGKSVPAKTDFTVTVTSGGTPSTATISSVSVVGGRVTLTLGTAVKKGDVVTVSYQPGANPLQDTYKSLVSPFTGILVTNQTAR